MNKLLIIGHRGAGGHAPENTLASIRKAAELGAQWVEFDIMLSRDNKIILFHDDSLKRTTGNKANVADTDWKDLKTLDAGSWFSAQFAGERIPLFSTVLDLLAELGLGAVVEIKPSKGRDVETARLTVDMVKTHWPESLPRPIISSFNDPALAVARDCAPDIPRALNMWRTLRGWRKRLLALECTAFHCKHELLDEKKADAIVAAGYDLRCFTVNETERAETLFKWGVSSIFTDFPDRFV